jgi:hypothetical protein
MPIRGFTERQNLLHSAVAIRRNDQNRACNANTLRIHANHRVVVKFTLLPVIEKFVPISAATNLIQKAPKSQLCGKFLNTHTKR